MARFQRNPDNELDEGLLHNLAESRKFHRNKLPLTILYIAAASAILTLLLILAVTGYTASIAARMHVLLTDASETLAEIDELIPMAKESVRLLDDLCKFPEVAKYCGLNVTAPSSSPAFGPRY
jgi:hypothetical protein